MAAPASQAVSNTPKFIVIAEDHPFFGSIIVQAFTKFFLGKDTQVVWVNNTQDAESAAGGKPFSGSVLTKFTTETEQAEFASRNWEQVKPDVLLLDNQMPPRPGTDAEDDEGKGLATRVRAAGLKIFIASISSNPLEPELLQQGIFDADLQKPRLFANWGPNLIEAFNRASQKV